MVALLQKWRNGVLNSTDNPAPVRGNAEEISNWNRQSFSRRQEWGDGGRGGPGRKSEGVKKSWDVKGLLYPARAWE